MRLRYEWLGLAVALAFTGVLLGVISAAAQGTSPGPRATSPGHTDLDRGRYLVIIGGCNDCHTDDDAPHNGQVPESAWLLGSSVGFRGPWGTTYAPNLRVSLARMSETAWVKYTQTLQTRPPIPWFNLNVMTATDLRARYAGVSQYIDNLSALRALGAPGTIVFAFAR